MDTNVTTRGKSLKSLITHLVNDAKFDHTMDAVEIKETHISYVLLTGEYVYKFKKAVDFGFLDFTRLEKRKFYCEEEIRLNRRLAPDLYLDVITITGNHEHPEINGSDSIIEYAVKMRQFQKDSELDYLLSNGLFQPGYVDQLAETVANFHNHIQIATASNEYGHHDAINYSVFENINDLTECIVEDRLYSKKLKELYKWTKQKTASLKDTFIKRKKKGHIKECHGDLHLGNIALYQDKLVIFDCIEFSDDLRWIDTICDVAFLIMDFEAHGNVSFAYRFLNDYLEYSGDYEGLALLRFYCVYRALVRAKICAITFSEEKSNQKKVALMHQYQRYIELALHYINSNSAFLLITYGLSGSGKTTLSRPLLEALGAIRIRSDVERKRINHYNPSALSHSKLLKGLYTKNKSNQIYQYLTDVAEKIMATDYPVIVDATFLMKKHRRLFATLASRLKVPYVILNFVASKENLIKRIKDRKKQSRDASDADVNVLEYQIKHAIPLDATEQDNSILIDTNEKINYPTLINQIKSKLTRDIAKDIDHT